MYDIPYTSVSSFVLLMSSLTMVLALAAIQRGDHRRLRIWLLATAFLGTLFIGGQVYEFTVFTHEGLNLSTSVAASSFFVLTGFHGVHVTVGILWLLSLVGISLRGQLPAEKHLQVEIAGLYWHFVDIVWIVIFTVVYLVPEHALGSTLSNGRRRARAPVATAGGDPEAPNWKPHPGRGGPGAGPPRARAQPPEPDQVRRHRHPPGRHHRLEVALYYITMPEWLDGDLPAGPGHSSSSRWWPPSSCT